MSDKDVISPDFGKPHLSIKRRDFSGCQHGRVAVDEVLRVVHCLDCEAELDPVEVLLGYAKKERNFHYNKETGKNMMKKINESIDKLKAEENRIKSWIRYAEKKERGKPPHG